ncbi:MAG: hypothetical protein Q9228_004821, partial [Teloschistes exilis]
TRTDPPPLPPMHEQIRHAHFFPPDWWSHGRNRVRGRYFHDGLRGSGDFLGGGLLRGHLLHDDLPKVFRGAPPMDYIPSLQFRRRTNYETLDMGASAIRYGLYHHLSQSPRVVALLPWKLPFVRALLGVVEPPSMVRMAD